MYRHICILIMCSAGLIAFLSAHSVAELPWKHLRSPKEKEAIAILERARGSAQFDADGKATGITILGESENVLTNIDFGVFSHVESIFISCNKKRKISLLQYTILPSKLRSLSIVNTDVDEDELSLFLMNQKALKFLFLSSTNITDRTLRTISKSEQLYMLILDGTIITDKGLGYLENLQNLSSLNISNTNISDNGIEAIRKMPNLGILIMNGTRITDKSMLKFAELNDLTRLEIRKTQVTEEGRRKLRELRPNLMIDE